MVRYTCGSCGLRVYEHDIAAREGLQRARAHVQTSFCPVCDVPTEISCAQQTPRAPASMTVGTVGPRGVLSVLHVRLSKIVAQVD